MEEILAMVFSTLPNSLLLDTFFQELLDRIIGYCKTLKICGKIGITDSMYDIFVKISPIMQNYVLPIIKEDRLLSFMMSNGDRLVIFHVNRTNSGYYVECNINERTKYMKLYFTKENNQSKIKYIIEEKENGIYKDYHCDIYYYDGSYHVINKETAAKEVIREFSNTFYIPIEMVAFLKSNFKKYALELSKNKILSEMKLDDETRPIRDKYTFINPFLSYRKLHQNLKEFTVDIRMFLIYN